MPAFNAAKFLPSAIASVRGQTETRWELLVVDDCSVDSSVEVALELSRRDSRIRVLSMEKNGGVAEARNLGLQNSQGKYICFLDSDDYWLPEKLAKQLVLFEAGHKVVFSSYFRYLPNKRFSLVPSALKVNATNFDFGNPIGNLTGSYNRDVLGLVFQSKCGHEDYVMWRELVMKAGSATSVPVPLAIYTVSNSSLSGAKNKAAKWQWGLLREQFKFTFPYAIFAFCVYLASRIWLRIREKFTARHSPELLKVVA
jgi:glycosyltransferase involved in cell wall biosynthesis